MQGDEVRARKEVVQFDLLDAEVARTLGRQKRIERDDTHAQADRAIGKRSKPMLPQPMMPSVLPVISTPMKRFFSHLPAWVEASAAGISRATANIIAIACSAVVMELPNGVFHHDDAACRGRRNVDIVDADAGPADHLQPPGAFEHRRGDLARGADGQAIVIAQDRGEPVLVLAERGLEVRLDTALLENRHGGGRERIGDKDAWRHGRLLMVHPSRRVLWTLLRMRREEAVMGPEQRLRGRIATGESPSPA